VPYSNLENAVDDRIFDSIPVPADLPTGWRVDFAQGAQVEEAEHLEYEVFLSVGFCEPSSAGRIEEFDPWRADSRFKVVLDSDDRIRGLVRELYGRYDDLPVGTFRRYADYPPDPVIEYASLAVDPDVQSTGVAEWLYASVWQDAIRVGAGGLVGVGADWMLTILNDVWNLGFRQLGEGRWYMGGDCIPIGTSLADMMKRFKRQPTLFRWLVEEMDLRDLHLPEIRSAVESARAAGGGVGEQRFSGRGGNR
jgi:GNAT superfamily N-acetyltransferase